MPEIPLEDRKALLQTKTEIERMKIALSLRALRDMVMPTQSLDRSERSEATGIVARFLSATLGKAKVTRLRQGATIALMLWRIWRKWHRR